MLFHTKTQVIFFASLERTSDAGSVYLT